jgi:hypothetical protein
MTPSGRLADLVMVAVPTGVAAQDPVPTNARVLDG